VLVIKVGGSDGIDLDAVCDDVAALVRDGLPLVLVHGGSHMTNEIAERLGHPPTFVTSPSGFTSRRTDRRTLEIFEMVYCGLVNKGIVERLQRRRVRAIGLAGLDGPVWEGRRKSSIRSVVDGRVVVIRDDFTGTVERVDVGLLHALLDRGLVPVLTPPALSVDGEAINVDGDRAAAATAAALGATELVILSNVPGVLADPGDPSTLVRRVARDELAAAGAHARGRMRIKVLGASEALSGGVQRVILADATGPNPILRALEGCGTVFE
jgi:acetylglutamate/LysW-gamma-L-alpha-aminoadipate kinase